MANLGGALGVFKLAVSELATGVGGGFVEGGALGVFKLAVSELATAPVAAAGGAIEAEGAVPLAVCTLAVSELATGPVAAVVGGRIKTEGARPLAVSEKATGVVTRTLMEGAGVRPLAMFGLAVFELTVFERATGSTVECT